MGADFTSKHFRTWGGTKTAAGLFAARRCRRPSARRGSTLNGLIDQVAAAARQHPRDLPQMLHPPAVIEVLATGTLEAEIAAARKSFRKPIDGLDEEETLVLKWLKARDAA